MSLVYPVRRYGRFGLALGLTPRLLHERFGLDLGERFHRDIIHRIRSVMDMDRLAWEAFGGIGIGFEEPFPRATIEPFGHRFVPVLYGCPCVYASGEEPAVRTLPLDPDVIRSMPTWTPERFLSQDAVREVLAQAAVVRERFGNACEAARVRMGENPHAIPLSSLQNLGSTINTAVSTFGEQVLCLYVEDSRLLRTSYRGVTDLMLLALRIFPDRDGRGLPLVFVGNCTVAMISPRQYAECNAGFDAELSAFAGSIGARFLVHQDSDATPHLASYARLAPVHGIDLGQDTDFARAAVIFPGASANCILFPSWIASTPLQGIREELGRLMRLGRRFSDFTFSLFEVDPGLAGGRVFELVEIFRECAGKESEGSPE